MNIKEYETFIMNKARDLEVSLFNYYFLNEEIDNCLLALSLYINEDGGISNIDPDNLNNKSTLAASIYFLNILSNLNYKLEDNLFNEILNDLINYLKKQKQFSYYTKSNDSKPCSLKYKTNESSLALEVITYTYIYYYSNKPKHLLEKINNLIKLYLNNPNPTFEELYYFKKVESLINNEELKNKIIKDALLFLNDYKNDLSILIFNESDYLLNNYKKEFLDYSKHLLNNKNSIGVWERNETWGNDYPEEESANIKYLSITLLNKLLFLKRVGI